MRVTLQVVLAVVLTSSFVTGCISTVDGRHKAGVPFSQDKIESAYNLPANQVVAAARDVLAHYGTITSEDTVRLTFEALVDYRMVWMKIEPQESNLTKLTTQCRTKGGNADLDLATYLDKQVAVRLASGTLGAGALVKPTK